MIARRAGEWSTDRAEWSGRLPRDAARSHVPAAGPRPIESRTVRTFRGRRRSVRRATVPWAAAGRPPTSAGSADCIRGTLGSITAGSVPILGPSRPSHPGPSVATCPRPSRPPRRRADPATDRAYVPAVGIRPIAEAGQPATRGGGPARLRAPCLRESSDRNPRPVARARPAPLGAGRPQIARPPAPIADDQPTRDARRREVGTVNLDRCAEAPSSQDRAMPGHGRSDAACGIVVGCPSRIQSAAMRPSAGDDWSPEPPAAGDGHDRRPAGMRTDHRPAVRSHRVDAGPDVAEAHVRRGPAGAGRDAPPRARCTHRRCREPRRPDPRCRG